MVARRVLRAAAAVTAVSSDLAERPRLECCVAQLGIAGRVRFLGETARILEAIGDADVFASPALGEGFGLAAAEGAVLRRRLEPAAVGERFESLYRSVASQRTRADRA